MLCQTIMNAMGWSKPGGQRFTVQDFLLDFLPKQIVRQPQHVIEAEIRAWVSGTNASFKEQTRGI